MVLLFFGAIFGCYYGIKSLIKRWIYFKKFIGNQPINHLFKMLNKQKGLQYFDKMLITGYPLRDTQKLSSFFYMIKQKQLEVEIILPFTNILIPKVEFERGEYLLFGDFIYNSKHQVIRCKRIRDLYLINDKDLNRINKLFYFQNIMLLLLQIGFIGICLYTMLQIIKQQLIIENYGQRNQVYISKYHQNFKCKICKNHNSNIILQPCSHLICCEQCYGHRWQRYFCPICKTYIQNSYKIFNE